MEQTKSIIERIQDWTRHSLSLKLLTIGFIILILLIPQSFTADLIQERQNRSGEAEEEVTNKWSRQQTLIGPYISIPFFKERAVEVEGKSRIIKEMNTFYIFPDELSIDGDIQAESLHRGIFDVVVYKSTLNINGVFSEVDFEKSGIDIEKILWDKVKFHLSVSDLRGIGGSSVININDEQMISEPYTDDVNRISGLSTDLKSDTDQINVAFNCVLSLKGSKQMYFSPVGKSTKLRLSGNWENPSFQGSFLPEYREISDDGFEANWEVLHFNRPFGQQFVGKLPVMTDAVFGLSLRMPVDQYQKSTRSSKYALLVILLSFLSMFLIEVMAKNKIHPLQYLLVGLALILYYTLLISFSEHLGFTMSYLIASLATISLLAIYAKSVFRKVKHTAIFSGMLTLFYGFIFIIIKEQDYALLIGSIGLFIALAVTMIVTSKINWYQKE